MINPYKSNTLSKLNESIKRYFDTLNIEFEKKLKNLEIGLKVISEFPQIKTVKNVIDVTQKLRQNKTN